MSCDECPEPNRIPETTSARVCIMPRSSTTKQLANLLTAAHLKMGEDGAIDSDTPLEGLRQVGDKYYLDWVICTWRLLNINLSKVSASCLLQLDTSQCETCVRRHR